MNRYRLTSRARSDLVEIWERIAEDSETAADAFVDRLMTTIRGLGSNPFIGRRRDELRRGYRSFPVGRYVVFYRVAEPGVEVMHVIHGARDLTRLLGD